MQPEIIGISLTSPDRVEVVLHFTDGEHTFGIRVDPQPPLTLLHAEEEMEAQLRPWLSIYKEVMHWCGVLLRGPSAAIAAK